MRSGTFYVYVVELTMTRSLYVGSTGLSPEERFRHHKSPAHYRAASRHVRRFGRRLRADLAPRAPFTSRDAAKRAEKELRHELRRRGFRVYGS